MTVLEGCRNPAFSNEEVKDKQQIPSEKQQIRLEEQGESLHTEIVRDKWSNPTEFILSCIALSVGLGNVWRFPATALSNGGGAFLVPYLCILTFVGRPLYFMELCMGQFTSFGCVKVWNMVPAMKGIGYAQTFATWCLLTYYVALIAITMFYFFASFASELPWSKCPENATNCFDSTTNITGMNLTTILSASERYFKYEVSRIHENGFDDGIFAPDWRLTLCLLASWTIIFCILAKGVQSSGKASYFMALFPYFVLFILLIKGSLLPGAAKGIMYFISPQWHKLLEPNVWKNAVGQCFFSLSVGLGSVTMMSSYNDFRHNIYRDALIIATIDTFTSILAGCITFGIMGHLAEQMGLDDVQDVIKDGGVGLAFISYPDVLSRFTWCPQLFAVLFFLMLFTLGVGSAIGAAGSVVTIICDNFPNYNRRTVTLILVATSFVVGIIYVTPQGQFIMALVDAFAGNTAIYITAIAEIISVQYIYGYKRFLMDIQYMLGRKIGLYWKLCWVVIMPVALCTILVYSFFEMEPITKGSYTFGPIAVGLATGLAVAILSLIPLFVFMQWKKSTDVSTSNALRGIFQPSEKWGPRDPNLNTDYNMYITKYLNQLKARKD